jgi:carboxylesterase type B
MYRGGISVAMQMAVYGGRDDGLFRGAILQSGSISVFPWEKANSNKLNEIFARVTSRLGCANVTDQLGCIREVPYDKIVSAFDVFQRSKMPLMTPTIDGDLFHEHPVKSFQEGRYVKIPTIVGTTQDEGGIVPTAGPLNTDQDIRNAISSNHLSNKAW